MTSADGEFNPFVASETRGGFDIGFIRLRNSQNMPTSWRPAATGC
jgi:hypothetical protein